MNKIFELASGFRIKLGNIHYDPESWYYDASPGIDLHTIVYRWVKQRPGKDKYGNPLPPQKIYDRSMPVMMPIEDIWPHREYEWTRSQNRYQQLGLDQEEWDKLKISMMENGWNPDYPLHFQIGQEGGMKVGEGNHRLAIAKELGMKEIPVWFHFYHDKVKKNPQHRI